MKSSPLLFVVVLILVGITATGFQCGSAETTSAKLYIQRGDLASAEKSLVKEVEKNPANAEAWYTLGEVRMRQKNYKAMMDAWDGSLKANKEFETQINTNKLATWGKSLNDGVAFFKKSATASKDSARDFLAQAIELYKTALMVVSESTVTYQNMALAYHAMGSYDEEIASIMTALKIKEDPQFLPLLANAYLSKAQDAQKAKNEDAAVDAYTKTTDYLKRARANEPGNAEYVQMESDVHTQIGVIHLRRDNLEASIPHFDAAVALDSTSQDALYNGALANLKLGVKMRESEKGENLKPADRPSAAKIKHAAALLEKFVSAKKDDGNAWEVLGTCYSLLGMTKEAGTAMKTSDALKKK